MFSSLVSVTTGISIDCDTGFGMTGEMSLTGKVLEVDGIKAKLEHAVSKGLDRVLIPRANHDEALKVLKENHWDDAVELIAVSDILGLLKHVFVVNDTSSSSIGIGEYVCGGGNRRRRSGVFIGGGEEVICH